MKLRTLEDKYSFLSEMNRLDLINTDTIDIELYELFIKQRKPLVKQLKDFNKSTTQKENWIKWRWRYLKGIRKFHRSIAGKKLHRAMSRFLATRIFSPNQKEKMEGLVFDGTPKAVSSLKTHLYIESEYYMPLTEHVEFVELVDYSLPVLQSIEYKVYTKEDELTNDEHELLLRYTDEKELIKEIANMFNLDVDSVTSELSTRKNSQTNYNELTYGLTYVFNNLAASEMFKC